MSLISRTILATLTATYVLLSLSVTHAQPPSPEKEIRLGMSNVLTGPAAALGIELREGAFTYFNLLNQQGGIHGRTINLISLDDGYEPTRTITNVRKLIEEYKVYAFFGFVGTPTSKVAVPIATHAKIPFFAPFTGAEFLRNPVPPYVFNVRASYNDETEALISYAVDKLGHKRIAMFIQDDAYGTAGRSGTEKALAKRKLTAVSVAKYPRNTTQVTAAVNQLKASGATTVIMVGAYQPCAAFIKESRAAGFNPIFMNISFVGTNALIEALQKDGEGVYISQVMPSPYDTTIPIIAEYHTALAKHPGHKPSYGSLEGYISAKVLAEVFTRQGPSLNQADFLPTAESIHDLDLGGLKLSFSPTSHQGLKDIYLTQIKDGKPMPVVR